MENNFEPALITTLKFEGGFVDNPGDPGGATNRGITQRVYNIYRTSKNKAIQSVKFISDAEMRDIYYHNYWLPAKCRDLPANLDIIHFDTAFNCGVRQAALLLQRTVGATADGKVGLKTIAAAKKMDPNAAVKGYAKNRIDFCIGLVVDNPDRLQFLKGWVSRAWVFI